jgi:nitroreductase
VTVTDNVSDTLDANAVRWLGAIEVRRSRRSYDGTPVAAEDLDALDALARAFRPWPEARVELLREAPDSVFLGIIGAYGGVSGATSAFAFIGPHEGGHEQVGCTGQALVLEATARGLNTCWVGGLFGSAPVTHLLGLSADERVFAVSPVGHACEVPTRKERLIFGAGKPKHRRTIATIAPGHEGWPSWASRAAEAVRVAPSAMNREPWRLRMEDGALVIGMEGVGTPRISRRLDCGIAMLHAEVAARAEGVGGTWELLASPDVARYVPDGL